MLYVGVVKVQIVTFMYYAIHCLAKVTTVAVLRMVLPD